MALPRRHRRWRFRQSLPEAHPGAARGDHPQQRKCAIELLEDRWMLTADNWVGTAGGNWSTAGDWSAGIPSSTSTVTISTSNAQTINITSGTIAVQSLTIGGNDALTFTGGSLSVSGGLSNSGTFTVGIGVTAAAGTFSQASSGTLDVQLGGIASTGKFGQFNVSGAATLAGTFKANLVSGYTPSTSDTFTPLDYSSETGSFSSFSLPSGSGYQFDGAVTFTNTVISAAPTSTVTSTINANATVGAATPNLLGVNLTYWDDQLPTTQTQQMVSAAGMQLYRFPGGSASDDYHFNVSANYGYSAADTVPEFAQFISAVGGTGVVTLDYGSGSPQEAAAELAYLEGSTSDATSIGAGWEWNDSSSQWQSVNWGTVGDWARLRAASPLQSDDGLNFMRIDHPAPFTDIKYWEVGNEEYGSWEVDHHGTNAPGGISTGAQHDPATYAAFAEQFALYAAGITAKAGIPAISIGIDSQDPTGAADNNWTKNVLIDGLADSFVPGFISDHSYMQAPGYEADSTLLNDTVSQAGNLLDWSTRYADYESLLNQTLSSQASSVAVLATELNSVYSDPGKQTTSLVNGLFIANSLGSLVDSGYQGAIVWDLRNAWQTSDNDSNLLYGWRKGGDYGQLGDPYTTLLPTTGAYVAYPGYYAEQLASKMITAGAKGVSATSNYGDLDVYAVDQADGHLDLMIINTNPAASITDHFSLSGFQPGASAQAWQYGEAQDTAQSQSSNGASALASSTSPLSVSGSTFSYTFPAYSMTVLDLTPQPSVTASGNTAGYTAGGSPVAVDGGIAVSSADARLSGAVLAISGATLQSGDTLNFSSQNGITGTYSPATGTLTLTGSATPGQYQTALESVTFSNAADTSTQARSVSVVVDDGAVTSTPVSETIAVSAPATVTALYVAGTSWTSAFNNYLAGNSLGSSTTPSLGFALQTGVNQSKDLPWINLNVIEATFSEPVTLTQGSLILTGDSESGYSVPSVAGFSTLGTSTYAWTLSSSLTANRLEISFLSTGANAVTDSRGAGLSGNWTGGVSSFSPSGSGDGLAGTSSGPNSGVTSDFNFLFNVLPGDSARNGITVNPTDATDVKNKSGSSTASGNYVPYYDVIGSGVINPTDFTDVKNRSGNAQASTSFGPSPQDSSAGGLTTSGGDADLSGEMLAVQEGSTSQTGSGAVLAVSNQTTGGAATARLGATGSSDSLDSSDNLATSLSTANLETDSTTASDAVVSDFDLADLWA